MRDKNGMMVESDVIMSLTANYSDVLLRTCDLNSANPGVSY